MPSSPAHQSYRAFLATRWPMRTRALAMHAFVGTFGLAVLDALFLRALGQPTEVATALAARLPWAVVPVMGWLFLVAAPGARLLPAVTLALSLLWTWGNAWTYLALGLGTSVLYPVARLAWMVTVATFLPVSGPARAAVFLALWLASPALSLAYPPPDLGRWLATEVVVLAFGAIQLAVFHRNALNQRRGIILRGRLERAVLALESSRQQAAGAVAEVGRLAASVAHEVNNPLSALKVNVRWLGSDSAASEPPGERVEVVADTLAAVERIARIVADLKQRAAEHDESVHRARPSEEETTTIREISGEREIR